MGALQARMNMEEVEFVPSLRNSCRVGTSYGPTQKTTDFESAKVKMFVKTRESFGQTLDVWLSEGIEEPLWLLGLPTPMES